MSMSVDQYVPRKGHAFNAILRKGGRRARGCPMACTGTRDGMVSAIDGDGNERKMYNSAWQFERSLKERADG